MSYLVIARKWRPQVFDEVVGQPHVTRTLQNAVRSKRIAHAYLFTGARGVGKTSVARILAKTLNCEGDMTSAPCNACSNCREITQGNAVDVLEIDGASNRGIDDIRELRETVRYRPAKSRYKIYIIDEVHMLTDAAFNALLKTLEEPPEHVVFVFATTEPHKIPATILSRCQRFDFRRIPIPLLVGHLRNIADQEQAQLSDGVLYAVAREADGSMRDAQSLLEQLLAFSGDGLSDEDILDVLGVVDRRSVHRVGTAILDGDVRACLDVANELHRRGIDSRRFCQQLCDHFRNLLFLALEGAQTESPMDLPREEKDLLRIEIAKTTPESLYLYFQMILKGEEEIRRSSLPRITLEMLLLRLSQLPRLESLETVLEKIAALEGRLGGVDGGRGVGFGAAPAPPPPPLPPAAA
ncbi:DNA polymerase III subunit gamma/tau, partial [Desulforhabdus sp. TSK]|uniref:DNA polymerase III subunit gamma/tau n=1 Tax=Desulforhabdus sp. TSK TaxID=2925014 RepID=UPI001FC8BCDB